MKTWLKRTFFGIASAAIVLGSLTACAHRGMGGDWNSSSADSAQMRGRMLERVGTQLKLDDSQKQRLQVLADKLHEQHTALMGSTDPRDDFQALLAGPTFNRNQAQALVDAKTAAIQAKAPDVIAAAGDFFDSLRPDQQQQVRDFVSKHRGHRS